ncbi:hypothetical protein ABT330_19845 [Streptomyces sp. NPDC000658]|uniref:hypothetical protein n=1 Tax=Streptomyces sp. NPDC000658 TaxID=3154266 RepID=UPI003326EB2E
MLIEGDSTRRIDVDDPEVNMDDAQRLLYRGELFTGEVTEYLGNALVVFDDDGLTFRESYEWDEDGRPTKSWRLGDGF